jgi:simple sugar transport system permease protein
MTGRSRPAERAAGAVAASAGLAAGLLALSLLVWAYGESPRAVVVQLVAGTWAVPYGVGQVLYKATPLLLAGVAVDLALRAGLFNIGAEGQLAVAGLAVGTLGARLPAEAPPWLALPLVLAAAALAGTAWAALPALLRARYGAHEVISTIMMNRIADVAIAAGLAGGLAIPGTVRTPDVVRGARLPRLEALGLASLHGSAVSLALPLAVATAAAVAVWLARSRVGRETVLAGLSPRACGAEGIAVAWRLGGAMLLSGAVAGLAAVAPVLGYKRYYESGLGAGAGFGGIAVALLGRGHPVGLVLAALLFGTLEQGGLAVNANVPMEVMTVLQGVVVVAVAFADSRVRVALRSSAEGSARSPESGAKHRRGTPR